MNINDYKDFKLYEDGELVAKFSKLSISVAGNEDDYSLGYVAEDLYLEPNFHFLNDRTNKYTITFKGESSGVEGDYVLTDCVIDNRTTASDNFSRLARIEGIFTSINFNINNE